MKILILANYGMGLYKFRKELLQEFIQQNHEVYISLPRDEYTSKLEDLGCRFVETSVDRRGTHPIRDLGLLMFYIRLMRKIRPDIALTYTIKPSTFGGVACRWTGTPYIANITGLGTAMVNKGMMQNITKTLYRLGLKKARCVFFQNVQNKQFFTGHRLIKKEAARLIPGSGVNVTEHSYEEYPPAGETLNCLFIGRIMKAKGIDELLEAAGKVKVRYPHIRFDLVGGCEEHYEDKLADYENRGLITYRGVQTDVKSFIRKSHVAILPSYHEGTANVLLESAAAGRPVLASRVAGCVETFDEGISGLGFEVKDADSLAETILHFANLPHEKKQAMGAAGRAKMLSEYDRKRVVGAYLEELDKINR
ncbi:glycosyltransferase family 4 protein [Paenibacillus lemnae]|uniref:Glycosyltransferase family 4 protein n=1 Tax=Paenibacillus lemnae TaxID=1330551 RepID=A0A848M9Q6_PAELE|nr:glycosyltransferase family 4 protein [Paenibacillus lemnae]NMO96633.1 glycosyltransferase family 4 protein [Paenibacillus lemnae]